MTSRRAGTNDPVIAILRNQARQQITLAGHHREQIRMLKDQLVKAEANLIDAETTHKNIEDAIKRLRSNPPEAEKPKCICRVRGVADLTCPEHGIDGHNPFGDGQA